MAVVVGSLFVFAGTASAATFTVNSTGDAHDLNFGGAFDGVCDTDAGAGVVCTLRAALEESNANGSAVVDAIDFNTGAMGVNPTITVAVGTTGSYPAITGEVNINGCSANLNSAAPCVGLRSDTAGSGTGLNVNVGGAAGSFVSSVKGLAMTNWSVAVRYSDFGHGSTTFNVQNDYFGTMLDGTSEANGFGLSIVGGNSVIGGDENAAGPTERNLFSNNTSTAVQIAAGDNNFIQGSYFGTNAAGTAAASPGNGENIEVVHNTTVPGYTDPSATTDNTRIGGTVTPAQHATNACDGVCNVIAGANGAGFTGFGIDLQGESANSEQPAGPTTVAGNFVGLMANGTALGNSTLGVRVGNADGVTIGGAAAEGRNYVTGGFHGITTLANPDGLVIRNNFIGLDPAGAALLSPPSSTGIIITSSSTADPPTIADNRIALATTADNPIQISTSVNTVVTGNVIGVGTGGQVLSSGSTAIRAVQMNSATITGNTIGNATGAGLRPGLTLEGSDNNVVRGNYIGTDSLGADHGNDGAAIRIAEFAGNASTGNVIGGNDAGGIGDENVLANNAGDAIEVLDVSSDNNVFRRNRGSVNPLNPASLFIDLNGDGLGNPGGVNEGVQPPAIDLANAGMVLGTATPGANVRVFATPSAGGQDITSFLGSAVAQPGGNWTVNYGSPQAHGQRIVATQTVPVAGTSELSMLATTDALFPETSIDSGPTGITNDSTPTFAYSSNEPGSTFECSLDQGTIAFQPCPGTGSGSFTPASALLDGAYTFRVRATDPATNTDQSPDTRGFTIDTSAPPAPPGDAGDADPPETTITAGPKDKTKEKVATFRFSSSEPGSTFECALDGQSSFKPCSSPLTLKVKKGRHTFSVRATDAAGNADPTPAADGWKVKKRRK